MSEHHHHHEGHEPAPQPHSQAEWDARYAEKDRLWSGNPNAQLVHEVTGLEPGRALDVGCGEGGDALWLAAQGWQVTGADISAVAVERARSHDPGNRVTWVHVDYRHERPEPNAYDLVNMQYFAMRREPGDPSLKALIAATAPGGTLLAVHHDPAELGHIPDVADYYFPADVARLLGTGWTIEVDEVRDRRSVAPSGAHHTKDVVLKAVRSL
ncbi:class I SAM-dependent methyltransferase [Spongisporangium articulatum]|uniref:Class I SAM-dependent methyltransferase n=1 Tax=Spongisporangium articulatum TaxID=3362603 RepID=A0ABW8AU61_9ACTN